MSVDIYGADEYIEGIDDVTDLLTMGPEDDMGLAGPRWERFKRRVRERRADRQERRAARAMRAARRAESKGHHKLAARLKKEAEVRGRMAKRVRETGFATKAGRVVLGAGAGGAAAGPVGAIIGAIVGRRRQRRAEKARKHQRKGGGGQMVEMAQTLASAVGKVAAHAAPEQGSGVSRGRLTMEDHARRWLSRHITVRRGHPLTVRNRETGGMVHLTVEMTTEALRNMLQYRSVSPETKSRIRRELTASYSPVNVASQVLSAGIGRIRGV